ncbi:light-regulated protein 1, chloroplastic [Primulina eburnea]|uniref:light-regulated protein 1, chloroplastic n=1 Tax=Primulina eburnea TaxID=1245227 RepID=UPI003C6C3EED
MQQAAALTLSSPLNVPRMLTPDHFPKPTCFASIKPLNALAVNYSSPISVFPAEACETIGGDTCVADVYPEIKLEATKTPHNIGREAVDREYLDYTTDDKTVLLGEACDVLGGEFCESSYQMGIC